MRAYNLTVASLAIAAPRKWTDNLLSQHELPDVISVRQGITRRIPYQALIRLAIVRQLHNELGMGVAKAVEFAARLLDSGHSPVLAAGQLTLGVDLPALRKPSTYGWPPPSNPPRRVRVDDPRGRPGRDSSSALLHHPRASDVIVRVTEAGAGNAAMLLVRQAHPRSHQLRQLGCHAVVTHREQEHLWR
jgi:hypothetical protein